MAKGFKTGGRKRGTPNKHSSAVKESLEAVFENLGGVPGMTVWAKANQTEFYGLWVKTLPKDVNLASDINKIIVEFK